MAHDKPDESWARDALDRLWPIIDGDDHLRDFEFTVSGYLDGRALYVSALGPKPLLEHSAAREYVPITYFLHLFTDDEWQIWRLIDRIHNLETLRLAATINIGKLTKVGERVEMLATLIEKAGEKVESTIKGVSINDPNSVFSQVPDEAMSEVQDKLAEINNIVPGDIFYRLDRSQFYIDQFLSSTDDLRAERVEGFQRYREFVLRRMGSIFGYIRLLRTRVTDIQLDISTLSRRYTSFKMASVTYSINSLAQAINSKDDDIDEIQDFGEIALIGFLMPYYVGSVLSHAFHDVVVGREDWFWMIILSASFLLLVAKRRKRDWEKIFLLKPSQSAILGLAIIWAAFYAKQNDLLQKIFPPIHGESSPPTH